MTKNNRCVECGRGEIELRKVKDFETRVRGIPFTVPEATIGICTSCGAKIFDPHEIRRWQKLFETDLLDTGKLLTASEIGSIRTSLALQISQFAQLMGTTRQSVYNWERDNRKGPQLRVVDLLLRLIRESKEHGATDVVAFLCEQAGLLSPSPRSLDVGQVMHRTRRRGGRIRWRERYEYESAFECSGAAEQLPRLRLR